MFNEISGAQPLFNVLREDRQDVVSVHGIGYTGAWPETSDVDRYLRRIAGGPGASFQFRAIYDRNKGRPPVLLCGIYGQCAPHLVALNKAGYGIFVIVNESTGTTDATVTDIRCVFVDLDNVELPDRKERLKYFSGSAVSVNIHKAWAGIAPMTMIVESSPGRHHIYWHCHAMPLDRFKSFQRGLAHVLGGDPSVCNLSRVMRVPGFLHQKGEPFLSRVLHVRSGHPNSVSADNLERALARTRKKFKAKEPVADARKALANPPSTDEAVDRILGKVATATLGTRNDTLFVSACRLREGALPWEYAREILTEAATLAGLGAREIATTLASAARRTAP